MVITLSDTHLSDCSTTHIFIPSLSSVYPLIQAYPTPPPPHPTPPHITHTHTPTTSSHSPHSPLLDALSSRDVHYHYFFFTSTPSPNLSHLLSLTHSHYPLTSSLPPTLLPFFAPHKYIPSLTHLSWMHSSRDVHYFFLGKY